MTRLFLAFVAVTGRGFASDALPPSSCTSDIAEEQTLLQVKVLARAEDADQEASLNFEEEHATEEEDENLAATSDRRRRRRRRRRDGSRRRRSSPSIGGFFNNAVNSVQDVANSAVDSVQSVANVQPLNTVIDAVQSAGNGAVDGGQTVVQGGLDLAGDAVDGVQDTVGIGIDGVQGLANSVVDIGQSVVPDADWLNSMVDGAQSAGNNLVNNVQHITGFEEDNPWTRRTNHHRRQFGACPVVWNQDLVEELEVWLNSLTTSMVHDAGRGPVGENLAGPCLGNCGGVNGGYGTFPWNEEGIVDAWHSEVAGCSGPQGCGYAQGHFTALIWKGVLSMGCAIASNGYAGCRYAPGPGEVAPNMPGAYADNVGAFGELSTGCPVLTAAGAIGLPDSPFW